MQEVQVHFYSHQMLALPGWFWPKAWLIWLCLLLFTRKYCHCNIQVGNRIYDLSYFYGPQAYGVGTFPVEPTTTITLTLPNSLTYKQLLDLGESTYTHMIKPRLSVSFKRNVLNWLGFPQPIAHCGTYVADILCFGGYHYVPKLNRATPLRLHTTLQELKTHAPC